MPWLRNLMFLGLTAVGLWVFAAYVFQAPQLPTETGMSGQYRELRPLMERIDGYFAEQWGTQGLQAAGPAPSLQVARRISLGLTGTVPSLEEIRWLEGIEPEKRVAAWTDHLLADDRFADYLSERLARAYVGVDNGPFLVYRRRRFTTWLSDQIQAKVPYDELVRRLITAEGLWTSEPEVNFLTVTLENNEDRRPDEIWLATRTARAFLGMRIDCLQCHDDHLGNVSLGPLAEPREGTQEDFHQLAAFFSEAYVSPLGIRDRNRDYAYRYLDAEDETIVDASPPYLADLELHGTSRRERLAEWVTSPRNLPFARAMVNRMWALLLGRPLVEPMEDIPLHGPLPEPLEWLAEDFIEHNYDLRRLIRAIVSTRVFQIDSAAEFEVTGAHEYRWAVFPLTRLRPEQVAGAMLQASSLETIDRQSHIVFQLQRSALESAFVRRYGDTGEDEFVDRGGTVAQRLLLMNGNLVKDRTENSWLNASTRIGMFATDNETAVELCYLTILTRRPTPNEREHFVARLAETSGNQRNRQLEDICWVLFNSTEFSWNH